MSDPQLTLGRVVEAPKVTGEAVVLLRRRFPSVLRSGRLVMEGFMEEVSFPVKTEAVCVFDVICTTPK